MDKKIEFIAVASLFGGYKPMTEPVKYENIDLIQKGNDVEYDLMLAYNLDKDNGIAYWGNWNNGKR